MIYQFKCPSCSVVTDVTAKAFHPPQGHVCECGELADRVYGCHIDTTGCRDVDDIPAKDRIACGPGTTNLTSGQTAAMERRHKKSIEKARKDRVGGNKGARRLTHQIPAELFHGKIKQTGDKNYWDDSKNRNRHKSCQVD